MAPMRALVRCAARQLVRTRPPLAEALWSSPQRRASSSSSSSTTTTTPTPTPTPTPEPRELEVGELQGAQFKIEPLRRTGEDGATKRARLLCQ